MSDVGSTASGAHHCCETMIHVGLTFPSFGVFHFFLYKGSYLDMSINEYGSTPGMLPSSNIGSVTPQESSQTDTSSDKWVSFLY